MQKPNKHIQCIYIIHPVLMCHHIKFIVSSATCHGGGTYNVSLFQW